MMEKLISKKDFNEGDLNDVLNECIVFLNDINKTYGSLLGKFEITDKNVCEDLIHHNLLHMKDVEFIVKKELNSTYLNKASKGFEFKTEMKAKKMIWKEVTYIKFSIISFIYYKEEKIYLNTIHFLIGDISAIDNKFVEDLNALNLDDKAREFLIEEHSLCDIVGCDVSTILNNVVYDIETTVKKNMTMFSPDNLEVDIRACIKENYEVLYKYVKTNIKSNRLDISLFNEKTSILFEEVRYLKAI